MARSNVGGRTGERVDEFTEIEQAAHALVLDAAAVEVVGALELHGIDGLLIKGPATAHWLYAESPEARRYADVDLLVESSRFTPAESVLQDLGFHHIHGDYRVDRQSWMYESEWVRPGPPPVHVDLHRGFHGVDDWEAFWTQLRSHASVLVVAGREVRIPDAAGCALIVALHHSSTGRTERSATDLRRAIAVFDDDVWSEASRRADDAAAHPSLVLGLISVEEGRRLVERLGLPTELPPEVATRSLVAAGVDPGTADRAWALQFRMRAAKGWRAKASVVCEIVFPPIEFFTDSRPLARRGRLGLLAARVAYPLDLAIRAPRILWVVLRGRRRARRSGRHA
jgi:hypothetical protein